MGHISPFSTGTLLTIGCCLLGGLLIVVACLALPLMLVLFITYTLSSLAFNLFSTTSSKIRQIKHMVVPAIASEESPQKYLACSNFSLVREWYSKCLLYDLKVSSSSWLQYSRKVFLLHRWNCIFTRLHNRVGLVFGGDCSSSSSNEW